MPDTGETLEIVLSRESCEPGDTIDATLTGYVDRAEFSWTADTGAITGDGGPEATYTCPEVECPGEEATLYCVAYDEEGGQDWAFARIEVRCAEEGCGCAGVVASPLLGVFAVLAAIGRRR